MRCLIRSLLVLLTLLILLVGIAYLITSSEVRVERSLTIQAPPGKIFDQVNHLPTWATWSPWQLRDPEMKTTYEGPESGVGAISRWESETQGSGSQTITESVSPERIVTTLDFGPMGTATSDWTFQPEGDATVVTWGMVSHNGHNLVFRLFGLFLDDMLGPDYEEGLANLQKRVEGRE